MTSIPRDNNLLICIHFFLFALFDICSWNVHISFLQNIYAYWKKTYHTVKVLEKSRETDYNK